MDSRDFRKTWLKLQESLNNGDEVSLNSTKAEKLEEKRKLPDALKAHQFGKKTDDKAPEKDVKEDDKSDKKEDKKEDKKDDKKPSFLKKKATEGKKPVVKGWTHSHAKQRVADAEKKKREAEKAEKKLSEEGSPAVAQLGEAIVDVGLKYITPDGESVWTVVGSGGKNKIVMQDEMGNHLLVSLKQLEKFTAVADKPTFPKNDEEADVMDHRLGGPNRLGEEGSPANAGGATTSAAVGAAKGTCPDAHIGAPERLKKRNESQLFSHFKRFMAEAGLPVDMEAPPVAGILGQDVAADAVGELTGEEPMMDPALDAPVDDTASVLADIQARFPGKKIHICVEADPTEPFAAEDVAAAEASIAAVPEDVGGLEGDEGAEEMLSPEGGEEIGAEEGIPGEIKAESFSVREDEEEDMGAADGVEEIPTGGEMGAEAGVEGGEGLGDELDTEAGSEASPEMISLTPEQWNEFLAGGTEEGLGDELAGATDVADAGEGEDSDSGSNKSQDKIG